MFDLDGVVIDSAEIIRQCYRDAGVNPPDDILAYEGVDWITPQGADPKRVRDIKNELYLKRVCTAPLAAGMSAARAVLLQGVQSILVTNAPRGTTQVLRTAVRESSVVWPFFLSIERFSTPDRMALLSKLGEPGVYIDDQARLVDLPHGWKFVHYTTQSRDQLRKEVLSCVSA